MSVSVSCSLAYVEQGRSTCFVSRFEDVRACVAEMLERVPLLTCKSVRVPRRSVASSSFLLRNVAMSQSGRSGSLSGQPASQPDCQLAFAIRPPVTNVRPKPLAIRSAKQSEKAARIEAKIDQKSLPGGARGSQNRPKIDLGAPRALW